MFRSLQGLTERVANNGLELPRVSAYLGRPHRCDSATASSLGELGLASSQTYIPSLDGIRAVAVFLVVVSHAGLGHVVPGGLGVTIFFFLSGYLITTLLRREFELTGTISLPRFYLRRVLRIFPPLYVALGIATLLTVTGLLPGQVQAIPLLSQCLFLANYYQVYGEGHFIPGTGVLWSLAVEEHFYFLFPALCWWLLANCPRRSASFVLWGLCALVLVWRCILVIGHQVEEIRTYSCTDTRIDSILFGCAMGLFGNPFRDPAWLRGGLAKAGLLLGGGGLLLATLLFREEVFRETLRYTLQGIALIPLFWLAVRHPEWPVFRWLNWSWVRRVGVFSYTIYLVHYFLIYAVEAAIPDRQVVSGPVAAVLMVLIAAAMNRFVERPLARLRHRFRT